MLSTGGFDPTGMFIDESGKFYILYESGNIECISDAEGSVLNGVKFEKILVRCFGIQYALVQDINGKIYQCGTAQSVKCLSEQNNTPLNNCDIMKMYTCRENIYFLDSQGNLITWGRNRDYMSGKGTGISDSPLTTPTALNNIENHIFNGKKIASIGYEQSSSKMLALDSESKLYAWGSELTIPVEVETDGIEITNIINAYDSNDSDNNNDIEVTNSYLIDEAGNKYTLIYEGEKYKLTEYTENTDESDEIHGYIGIIDGEYEFSNDIETFENNEESKNLETVIKTHFEFIDDTLAIKLFVTKNGKVFYYTSTNFDL